MPLLRKMSRPEHMFSAILYKLFRRSNL